MTTHVEPTPTAVTPQSIVERDVQARKKWQEIVSSDAKRAVGIFDVDRSASNRWGDTLKDFNPALNAIIDAINVGGSNLQALVEAGLMKKFIVGVVDARGAIAIVQFNDTEAGKRIPLASHVMALSLICSVVKHWGVEPPSRTPERTALSALRKRWPDIIAKLFHEDTQVEDYNFSQERAYIHQITTKLLLVDDHFFKRLVRGKNDRTVTLFVRYLMKATSGTEYGAFVDIFSVVLPHTEDVHPPSMSDLTTTLNIFANVRKGSNNCLVTFFKKLGEGLPFLQYDPRFSLKLFEVIGGLWNFVTVDARAWNLCPSLVAQLPVILCLAQPFWKNLYTLLSTLAHQFQDVRSEDSFSRALNDVVIYNMIRRCHKPLSITLQKGRDRDASVLVVAFIQADVFGFLDSVVSCLSFEAGHGEGSHFFFVGVFLHDILTVCETYPNSISILRPRLPLPRLLRACLDAVYAHDANPPPSEITDANKMDLSALAWYSLARLQQMCTIRGECQARGCKTSGKLYRCKGCFTMLYCGTECQTRCVDLLGVVRIVVALQILY